MPSNKKILEEYVKTHCPKSWLKDIKNIEYHKSEDVIPLMSIARQAAYTDVIEALSHRITKEGKIDPNPFCTVMKANWFLWNCMVIDLKKKFKVK